MIPFKACIFDLDGTLLDTAGDVVRLLAEVVREHGLSDSGVTSDVVVGPPLTVGIPRACPGIDEATAQSILTIYRSRYNVSNYPNTRFFPGIPELLQGLAQAGIPLFVCTNKATAATAHVAECFALRPWFTEIICMDNTPGRIMSKAEMISSLVARHRLDEHSTVMIGDTSLDMQGGREAGVLTMAALYGYGSRESLLATAPNFLAEQPDWRHTFTPAP